MRKVIANLLEGVFVGLLMGALLILLDVELEPWHFAIIAVGAMAFTSVASELRRFIESGGQLYNYEWTYQYGEHTILVKASNKEELFINGKLVDQKKGISKKVELNGMLDSGEKITVIITAETIKKQLTTDKPIRCELLVNGKPLNAKSDL